MNPIKAATKIYKLRSSWLGEGGEPVPTPQAISRAETCLACPCNRARSWETVARTVVGWSLGIDKLRHELNLSTGTETGLHICDKCDCVLRCKVWVPLKHVVATTDIEALPANCWITTELTSPPPSA